ncbi:PREDICTED: UDP-glycosyltransferase 74B1 [Tarenaya hassleriana]|uniref:UDP-glycosyltransferase 74B1 n=1 Tax=Tarenaya hassleriana TaxID=28532 RepID=UPI00053C557B|nr:PREDICTED: UDP-glycosyltransferase 74B1 [Tarenaya hassleriana]
MAEAENKHRGHVVVMPYPVQGHLNPMIQFAKRLASKGVRATVATTSYTVSSISAASLAVEPISDGFEFCRIADPSFSVELHCESFKQHGSETLTRVIEKFKSTDSPVDCLVYDSFLPWGLDVARGTGVSAAAFFTNNLTVCSVLSRFSSGEFPLPVDPNAAPFRIRGLPPLNVDDLPSFVTRHRLSHPAHRQMLLGQFTNHENADWLFVNSFQGLETQDDESGDSEAIRAKLIGPMIPSAYLDGRIKGDKGYGASLWKPLSKECMDWLESKPSQSVAFVSFGSFANVTDKQLREIAFGLKESNFYILWVIKDAQIEKLPDGFVESVKDRALMVSWCNQLEVLAHDAVGCFLTHCGWNSTLEGLSLGVPMVGMPQWSDQQCDAKFIEQVWKVGYRAKEDVEGVVKREEIVRCLKGVMEGESSVKIRESSMEWKELAKKAMSEGGSSDLRIEEFVRTLGGTEK